MLYRRLAGRLVGFSLAALQIGGCAEVISTVGKLGGMAADELKIPRIGRSWYKSKPGYEKSIAPYVADEERFADFMNKYKERRKLSEKERLEVIVQLGIYKYAPQWIRSEIKAKIDKLTGATAPKGKAKPKGKKRVAANGLLLLAEAETFSPFSDQGLSDAGPQSFQVAQAQVLASPVFWAGLLVLTEATFAAAKNSKGVETIANIELSTTIDQINSDLKTEIVEQIHDEIEKHCQQNKCVDTRPQQPPPVVGEGEGGALCNEPPDPPMFCYEYHPDGKGPTHCGDTGIKAIQPHYHVWSRNPSGGGLCNWNKFGGREHAFCLRESIPMPNAPCSAFPSFIPRKFSR